jgi:hypothetical protein
MVINIFLSSHEEIVSLLCFRSRMHMAIKEKFLVGKQSLPNIVLILFSISCLDGGVHVRGM